MNHTSGKIVLRSRFVQDDEIGLGTRLWMAWVVFFKLLFDGRFAARVQSLNHAAPKLAEPTPDASPSETEQVEDKAAKEAELAAALAKARAEGVDAGQAAGAELGREQGALLLLSMLQADGRLVDFLKQDVANFDDQDIGAAARVVHEGCNKALKHRLEIEPVFTEKEGSKVSLEGTAKPLFKLTGAVGDGTAQRGVLKHKGWLAKTVKLPIPTKDFDAKILAKAEIEV